ncbi:MULTISPECIES: hypothetical protein [unclassified Tolypothrix]|uniref:hypothetical protein n=1 Tax=unclassified Tolypothrix TaxID=2649714 RepID=UPI0005EAB335|nr:MULTISPECIES: hypothetical protein [unclassified Tolypothrix]BAY93222.1 hypothetical protein NIES3275_52600 [Microchaete diplosiphon NIES-3275]EKF00240.1 hypothetical protein FDUTEX481_09171 [Tolypothrix sp. PCC 7601]MBE9085735.1 hypothetical protein [Tolypothrix sp. LEGE 11397]UYD27095.1 hypothetical protein HGR01_03010 [Tolypothrix sp. PCC 7712]UYD37045.1 hypothetical protein HG267_15755 [Tolypothrix sp. PCC 7601]
MDFIKKLIAGIVSFITGLLPGKNKKSNGYYLELDESKEAKPVAAVKEAAKEVGDSAKKAAVAVADNTKKAAETVADNAKKAAETVTSQAPAPSLNGTKTAASKSSKKKSAKEPKPADVALVQTAEGLKIEPGKNDKAVSAKVVKEQPKETTFAPKYVAAGAGSSNGRRRPGANMSVYLDMARQVKTPG